MPIDKSMCAVTVTVTTGARNIACLIEFLPNMHEGNSRIDPWCCRNTCNPSTQELGAEEPEIQGHPQLYNRLA